MGVGHSLKDTERQPPPKPESVLPAAMRQKIQKYLLPYHQTTEQHLVLQNEIKVILDLEFKALTSRDLE